MLPVVVVVVVAVGYAFAAGIAHRLMVRSRPKLLWGFEDLFSVMWPLIPGFYAMCGLFWVIERVGSRVVRAGQAVPDLLGKLAARWRRRGLHDDCVVNWAWLQAGGDPLHVPFGPCTRCEPTLRRHAERSLPRARVNL